MSKFRKIIFDEKKRIHSDQGVLGHPFPAGGTKLTNQTLSRMLTH
jgi:hypothetical protein